MNSEHLGDSYDFVKRVLLDVAPSEREDWVAITMASTSFSPDDQPLYEKFLGIEILGQFNQSPHPDNRDAFFNELKEYCDQNPVKHLLLDPCTGICPDRRRLIKKETSKRGEYVTVREIASLLDDNSSRLVMCYDQSYSRYHGEDDWFPKRKEKLELLHDERLSAFYFKSHTSILCASRDSKRIEKWKESLFEQGLPKNRIQELSSANTRNTKS